MRTKVSYKKLSESPHLTGRSLEGEDDDPIRLIDIEKANLQAYHDLSPEEKAQLVEEFAAERESCKLSGRATQRGRSQDIQNVCRKVDSLVRSGLSRFAGSN